jgi:hypothetical protein
MTQHKAAASAEPAAVLLMSDLGTVGGELQPPECAYFASFAIWCESRETLRLAAFLCTTPYCAERMSAGSAACKAANALFWSPEAIASSTLRTIVRMRERRALLISVRRAILRAAFFAEEVLAIVVPSVVPRPDLGFPGRRAATRLRAERSLGAYKGQGPQGQTLL